ncbi:Cell wall / vacuolar inhibitor of fructosidase 2 [Sesamum alatum]|uniref:Cell wall / vacuolar inhibitor of fructosidase 2 n=1 Tax=Sesamum alatum TaxID=300844 RepID=A0AAE1XSE3_9LAMI|nr:Cell wall / vacuolar inhibitor of fructosidase 2 [Sesamum alatum]
MGFSWFLLLVTLSFQLINPTLSANGNSDLIQQTCKNTKYYDLCVSSLKSDSSSLKADSKLGLALIMILSVKNDTAVRKVMKECADKYAFANDALQNSVQDLSTELYDYAYMHVMAAADYPNACRNAFKRYPGLVYPQELAVREEALKHICDVVLGIIDALGF